MQSCTETETPAIQNAKFAWKKDTFCLDKDKFFLEKDMFCYVEQMMTNNKQ